jgi:hypothetical protein
MKRIGVPINKNESEVMSAILLSFALTLSILYLSKWLHFLQVKTIFSPVDFLKSTLSEFHVQNEISVLHFKQSTYSLMFEYQSFASELMKYNGYIISATEV